MSAVWRAVWSEWLKRKRSLTSPLVLVSATFVPAIMLFARVWRSGALGTLYQDPNFWRVLWTQASESMALMVLPLATMVAVSLLTQIEDRANGWKQLHAAPVSLPAIFLGKLVVILGLVASILGIFTVAVYLVGVLPTVLVPGVGMPVSAFPISMVLRRDLAWFIDMLPMIGIQYALALRYRTFVAPLAIGMVLWILSMGLVGWQFSWLIPYSYVIRDYLGVEYGRHFVAPASPAVIAATVSLVSFGVGGALFALRKDKG